MLRYEFGIELEKVSFYGTGRVVLGHIISNSGIEADGANVEVIEKLPPPSSIRGVRSFPRHVGFYQQFIKVFSKIIKPSPICLSKMRPLNLMESV